MDERLKALLFPRALCLGCDEPREIDAGAPLCDRCREELETLRLTDGICPRCLSPRHSSDPCRFCGDGKMRHIASAFAPYRYHGVSQKLISRLKFQGIVRAAQPLYEGMLDCLAGASFDVMIPVPLHAKDLRARGFNQSELFCRHLSRATGLNYQNALIKIKKTKKQSSLGHEQREDNVKDAYLCIYPLYKKRVLLVDDVRTTGCTARACAAELLKAGAREVSLLTAAVASSYSKLSSSSSAPAL